MSKLAGASLPMRSPTRGLHCIVGRFTANNTSAPTKIVPGVGWSVARTGVGVYVVTFDRSFKKLLHVKPELVGATGNTKRAVVTQLNDGGVRTAASVRIELQNTAGTAADQTSLDVTFAAFAAQVK